MKVLFFFLLLISSQAFALDLKGHQFTDSYRFSLLEDTSFERFKGENIFLGSYAFVKSPFYTTNKNVSRVRGDIIDYNNVLTLGYSRYLTDNLTLGFDIIGVQNKVIGKSYSNIGDTNLRGKYLLTERKGDFALSLNPYLTLPTGKKENYTTARTMSGGLRAVMEKHLADWHFLGSAGYGHAPKNNFAIVDQRNLLLTQLGVSYDITSEWDANLEVTRNFTLSSDNRQDEGDYFLTAKNKTTDRLSLYGGAGLAGIQEAEKRNYTVFVGFKWSDADPEVKKIAAPAPVKLAPPVKTLSSRSQEATLGTIIVLENIYFGNGVSDVTPIEREKALKVVNAWKKLGDKISRVVIEGYASKRGMSEANTALAKKRTDEVIEILVSSGVPLALISSVNYGDNGIQDPEEWKNRKVQFRVYKK